MENYGCKTRVYRTNNICNWRINKWTLWSTGIEERKLYVTEHKQNIQNASSQIQDPDRSNKTILSKICCVNVACKPVCTIQQAWCLSRCVLLYLHATRDSELNADNKVLLQFMVEDTFMLLVHGLLLRLFLSSVIFIPAWSTFSEIQNNNYQESVTVQLLLQKIKRQQKTKQDTVIQR